MRSAAAGPVEAVRPRLAPGMTAEEAFVALFAASLSQAARNVSGAARGRDPEYLHQLRVGLRRLRASLRAFRPMVPRSCAEEVSAPLRALAPVLGEARDWDVAVAKLEALVRDADSPRATRGRFQRALRKGRRKAQIRLRRALGSGAFASALRIARDWQSRAPWREAAPTKAEARRRSLVTHARKQLGRMHRRLLGDAERLDWSDTAARHAFRIRLKRLRYACEFFGTSFEGRVARKFTRRLKRLQDLLGKLNDIAVARTLLADLLPASTRERRGALRARILERLAQEAALLEHDLPAAWRAVRKARGFW